MYFSKSRARLESSPQSQGVLAGFDAGFWVLAIFVAASLRLEFRFVELQFNGLLVVAAVLIVSTAGIGYLTHLYRGRFVTGSIDELDALARTAFIVTLVVGGSVVFLGNNIGIPRSLVFIAAPIFVLQSGAVRLYLRLVRLQAARGVGRGVPAIVYGAGDAAERLISQLQADSERPFTAMALLDDSVEKRNRWIRGVPMMGDWQSLRHAVENTGAKAVIVCIPRADSTLFRRVYKDSKALDLQVVVLPTLADYLRGGGVASDLRGVTIADLVGRTQVNLDTKDVLRLLRGKSVLVTGAGGSIGSELVTQIAGYSPAKLVLVDRDETLLQATESMLRRETLPPNYVSHLLDIRDEESVREAFDLHAPEVVFHAAALKHLPILEKFPDEAWKTNVLGTLNVIGNAARIGSEVCVNVSTDKAADPINVLGRSKKLGEQVTSWFAAESGKPFISVRFGNVLGSRGSLVPVLADYIEHGGPVELTHPDATRFFMSISEACQLVLQAASQGEGGDVLVLDMGEPVSIREIADRMIEMSGKNIDVVFTGLRPGEKVHEDLTSSDEIRLPSGHPLIFRVKATTMSPRELHSLKW